MTSSFVVWFRELYDPLPPETWMRSLQVGSQPSVMGPAWWKSRLWQPGITCGIRNRSRQPSRHSGCLGIYLSCVSVWASVHPVLWILDYLNVCVLVTYSPQHIVYNRQYDIIKMSTWYFVLVCAYLHWCAFFSVVNLGRTLFVMIWTIHTFPQWWWTQSQSVVNGGDDNGLHVWTMLNLLVLADLPWELITYNIIKINDWESRYDSGW